MKKSLTGKELQACAVQREGRDKPFSNSRTPPKYLCTHSLWGNRFMLRYKHLSINQTCDHSTRTINAVAVNVQADKTSHFLGGKDWL